MKEVVIGSGLVREVRFSVIRWDYRVERLVKNLLEALNEVKTRKVMPKAIQAMKEANDLGWYEGEKGIWVRRS